MRGVEDIRSAIDETDRLIVELLSKRLELVAEMATAKEEIGQPVYDPDRAEAVLRLAVNRAAELRSDTEVIGLVYKALLQSFLTFEENKASEFNKHNVAANSPARL